MNTATDIIASRPFAFSPNLARIAEEKAAGLILANARAGRHFKAVPASTKGKRLTPHMQQFVDCVRANPNLSVAQLAAALGITVKAVEMRFFYMRTDGHLPQAAGPLYLQHRPAAQRLRESGSSQGEIARILGISQTTAARALGNRR
jgi:hypothetical protein